MPEFEILWAPLSRKWQVWQRESDQSGCAVETLLSEYSSEGRATHEAALLRGELPAGTPYETPHGRRWFSLPGLRRSKASPSEAEFSEAKTESAPMAEPDPVLQQEPANQTPSFLANTHDVSEWQAGLIQRLELVRQHTERHEIESIRSILEEALLVVPDPQLDERAA